MFKNIGENEMRPKNEQNIIVIIPARGGSKGLPRKNIRLLAGKPLIAWTIEQAKNSKASYNVVVSTEDKEIGEIARNYGAVVIERPKDLAKDDTPTIDAIFHVLEVLKAKNYNPDIIILLQPTSPLRNAEDIDNAVKLFLNRSCESVVSACEVDTSPYWSFKIEDGYLKHIFEEKYLTMRRQELPQVYAPNGAIYISTPENLQKYKSFYCVKTIPYIMPPRRSVDIDEEIDFKFAEFLLRKQYEESQSKQ